MDLVLIMICVSKRLVQRFKAHFLGEQLVNPFPGDQSVTVVDGRTLKVQQQTRMLQGFIHTPWEL